LQFIIGKQYRASGEYCSPTKAEQFAYYLQISEPIVSKSSEQKNLPNSADRKYGTTDKLQAAAVLWIRTRMFMGLQDPDPFIIKQKK
jgi:hypothetical protein